MFSEKERIVQNVELADSFFLTFGMGRGIRGETEGQKELYSFHRALIDAGVPQFNYQLVTSIIPSKCRQIEFAQGKRILDLNKGSFVRAVMARISSRDEGYLSAVVAVAFPENPEECGLVAEGHGVFASPSDALRLQESTGKLAQTMLEDLNIKAKKKCASVLAFTESDGDKWTTALTMAVYIQPCFAR